MPERVDVLVIGGGPGGSTVATMLRRKGWHVLLLERERFPREHIGESLLPASLPILEELGVLDAIRAEGFTVKWGATMLWGTEQEPWSWYFRETNPSNPHAFQVWRPRFDQLLLENARAAGVDIREGHTVIEPLFEGSRAVGARYRTDRGAEDLVYARMVVDASGQGAVLGRRLGLRRWDESFQNLAVYGYFEGARRLAEPDQGNIFIESYAHGWFWNIPLSNGVMSTGAVVDHQVGGEGIRVLGLGGYLDEQIRQAPRTAAMLAGARMIGGPVVVKDWSYVSDAITGDGWALVGDAACFIDPLFSSGVHLALTAGILAAAWVTTALRQPELAAAAGRVYQDLYYRQYGHFRAMAQLFYASNRTVDSYFWEARRLLGEDDRRTPRQAFIHAVAGQSPLGYERAVLERGQLPNAFTSEVAEVQAAREARRTRLTSGVLAVERATLRRAPGVRVERRPVLAEGEFVPGHVLITAGYPEGAPCSPLVAAVVLLIDGVTATRAIVARLCAGAGPESHPAIARAVHETLRILYVDGTVEEATPEHTPRPDGPSPDR